MNHANLKKSKQREAILTLLQGTGKHPAADWIYEQLRSKFPSLSMGTVYRNLNILIRQKLIQKIDSGSTFDRFEANTKPHYHFICESCGTITDLNLEIDKNLNTRVQDETSNKVLHHKIDFFGLCEHCAVRQGE